MSDLDHSDKRRRIDAVSLNSNSSNSVAASASASSVPTLAAPKFLSKAEREAIALAKLNEKRRVEEEARAESERKRAQFRALAKDEFRHQLQQSQAPPPRQSQYQQQQQQQQQQQSHAQTQAPYQQQQQQQQQRHESSASSRAANVPASDVSAAGEFVRSSSKTAAEIEQEQELIRKKYLGIRDEKPPVKTASERARFRFEWKAEDDTSRDINPLFQDRQTLRPLFGRGFIAGVDPKEQVAQHRELLERQRHEAARAERQRSERERHLERAQLEQLRAAERELDSPTLRGKHWSEKTLAEMDERDWRIFREDHQISTKGGSIPKPYRSWDEAQLPPALRDAVRRLGYTKPSAIQMQALPIAFTGRDLLGIAETGSGKTAAFLLPMMALILQLPPITSANAADGPYAIVMAPARELALQIEDAVRQLALGTTIKSVSLVGGQSIDVQTLQLTRGVEIVIATPGRLVECLESHILVLNQCNYVVLDEADRMIDLNFEESINKVLDAMPSTQWKSEDEAVAQEQERINRAAMIGADTNASERLHAKNAFRTTNLFSATMPPAVERLTRKYLRRAATIYIGERGQAVNRIHQVIRWVGSESGKRHALEELVAKSTPPMIVFVNTRRGVDAVAKSLEKIGWACAMLHSSRTQDQREAAISQFKAGRFPILVATDVAGRGIDVQGVTHVINYDLPTGPTAIELYTHRIGRTGRAGAQGLATTLVTADDSDVFYELGQFLAKSHNKTVAEEFAQHDSTLYPPDPSRKSRGPAKPLD
jgi:ATP-dependent RNA helicase DDX23/PRP28